MMCDICGMQGILTKTNSSNFSGGGGGEKLNLLKMEKNSCKKVQEDFKQTI